MRTHTNLGEIKSQKTDAVALFFFEDKNIFKKQAERARKIYGEISAVVRSEDFTGKKNTVTVVYPQNSRIIKRVFLIGLGKKDSCGLEQVRRAASAAARRAQTLKVKNLCFEFLNIDPLSNSNVAQAITEGAILGVYKFDKYFTDKKDKSKLKSVEISCSAAALIDEIKGGVDYATKLCQGVYLTRDLANAPNCEIYPETLAERAVKAGAEAGFDVTVLDKEKITELKMGGLLAVNQGSVRPPVFIIMEYRGGTEKEKPVVLVGKGITFDTGGISIKPGAGMMEMKLDMHGAASVIGAMYAVAKLKLPVNLIALVPSTENMPSGSAYVPGDVITHMNGKTSEVDNTDAEGRLVLADALTYADRYKPQAVVDIATLTGACLIALGTITTGMLGTDDSLKARLKNASLATSEYVCELPLYEEYEDQIKSDVADVKNSGGRPAGTITAALFLKKFIGNYPWVHLDIAGTGITSKEGFYSPKGGSGVGVRLFVEMLRKW